MNTLQLLDILKLGESEDLECKKSKNEVPKSLWDTYSAMANTNGVYYIIRNRWSR